MPDHQSRLTERSGLPRGVCPVVAHRRRPRAVGPAGGCGFRTRFHSLVLRPRQRLVHQGHSARGEQSCSVEAVMSMKMMGSLMAMRMTTVVRAPVAEQFPRQSRSLDLPRRQDPDLKGRRRLCWRRLRQVVQQRPLQLQRGAPPRPAAGACRQWWSPTILPSFSGIGEYEPYSAAIPPG